MDELDEVYLSRVLSKYSNELADTRDRKYFAIGYLVAQGYSFISAEQLTKEE